MHWTRKHTSIALAIVLTAATMIPVALSGCGQGAHGAPGGPPPPPAVTVAPVEQREIVEYVEFTGGVVPIDDVEVRPRVSGHIASVHFKTGDEVKKGQVLFMIDPRWNQAEVAMADAALAQAKVKLENAERESKRAENLKESRTISTEDAESRASRLAEARAEVQVAEASVDRARLDLAYTEIRAPVSGRVGRPLVTEGNYVSGVPGFNTVMTTIVSTDPVYVDADVDEDTMMRLQRALQAGELPVDADGKVQVETGRTDEDDFPHAGTVQAFENRIDPRTGSILLRAIVPNPDLHLVPGMFVRLRAPASAPKPTLFVSDRAIGTDQSQKFVLVLQEGNTVGYRKVELGPIVDGLRVIRSGLEAGETIVVNGLQRVRPGMPVTPQTEAEAQAATPQVAAH